MKQMDDFDRSFRRMNRVFWVFFSVVAALIAAMFIGYAVVAYKAISLVGEQDWSGGLKPVIERLWCGKPGCL